MKYLLVVISILSISGCYSNKTVCTQFEQVSGMTKANICWFPKEELIKNLDTIPDSISREIEVKMIPNGGRIQMVWSYDRIGTASEYIFGSEHRTKNQPMPISLLLEDETNKVKCGDLVKGFDSENEETEAIITCNMNKIPSKSMNITILDANGVALAKFVKN